MRILFKLTVITLLLQALGSQAQIDFPFQDGVDFQTIARPVLTADTSKIELVEIFWYGCPSCFNLEPNLVAFTSTLPEDVNVVKVPAMWHETMELHAKILFASQALGIVDETHQPVFDAMNKDGNKLASESEILDLVEELGQDRSDFQRAFNSFGVNSQVTQAKSKTVAYGMRGTPEIIINGKYRISLSMANTYEQMLAVAAALIERERNL